MQNSYEAETQAQKADGKDNSGNLTKTLQKPAFVIGVLIALVIGICLGTFFGIKRAQCVKGQKEGQGM